MDLVQKETLAAGQDAVRRLDESVVERLCKFVRWKAQQ